MFVAQSVLGAIQTLCRAYPIDPTRSPGRWCWARNGGYVMLLRAHGRCWGKTRMLPQGLWPSL